MPLTDTTIRNAKPGEKPRRLFDGRPVPGGGPRGRQGVAPEVSLRGQGEAHLARRHPAVGLREARARRDGARKQLAAGIDPSAARKAEKAAEADSFEAVAREWYAKHAPRWGPSVCVN